MGALLRKEETLAGAAAAPGIEQEFFDASEAFTKWCNAAGGINGRKIVIDKWDAKLFNVGQTTLDACQKDFMLVGGGNALDDAGVKPRLACKLGTIPAYTVTPAAANAGLQVKIQPGIATQVPFGVYRLLDQTYPDLKTKGIAIGSATLASLTEGGKKQQYALEHNGFKVTAVQVKPVLVDNFRPYMEQLKGNGTVGLYETSGQDITPEIQAMKNVGWTPQEVTYSYQFYTAQNVAAAKALGTFPPIYVGLDYLPLAAGVDTAGDQGDQGPADLDGVGPEVHPVHLGVLRLVAALRDVGHRVRRQPDAGLRTAKGRFPYGLDRRRNQPARLHQSRGH